MTTVRRNTCRNYEIKSCCQSPICNN